MSAPLHAQVYSSLARSEDLVKSIDVLEPGLRSEARSAAMAELTASVALHGRARHQGNVARYGSVEGLRSREMLVLAAEVALTNGHYGLAREKNREFFLSNPPRDQFFARCLFVVASCDAQKTEEEELNGSEATRQRLKSLAHILDALDIAKTHSPRYDFLVYNASVHFWNIARPMLREGGGRYAAPSMAKVSDALEALDDADLPWRITFLVALSQAEDDAGNANAAAGRLLKAVELVTKLSEKASDEDTQAQAAMDIADEALKRAQKMVRCAQEGKPMEPEPAVRWTEFSRLPMPPPLFSLPPPPTTLAVILSSAYFPHPKPYVHADLIPNLTNEPGGAGGRACQRQRKEGSAASCSGGTNRSRCVQHSHGRRS